ncbi:hypothetical protein [Staphylococcus chromogenes]|uniref:hypothetical protein n=1 Tax=Staphylococcus chromogenes TaxID=46126 RepID=UPI001C3CB215|nr:hypothetical protein [Staphylococcus chromogenes]MBV5138476.1 hypothetical protein [Staphylococcus chromogenes]MBW6089970.1 hypothetical protein [Staphylococcus chromogenes]
MNEEHKKELMSILNDKNYHLTKAKLIFLALRRGGADYNRSVGYLIKALNENNRPKEDFETQSMLPTLLSILAMTISILAVVLQILN